jgi:hypothetical protein
MQQNLKFMTIREDDLFKPMEYSRGYKATIIVDKK